MYIFISLTMLVFLLQTTPSVALGDIAADENTFKESIPLLWMLQCQGGNPSNLLDNGTTINNLKIIDILTLNFLIEKNFKSDLLSAEAKTRLKAVEEKLQPHIDIILSTWTNYVKSERYSQIVSFATNFENEFISYIERFVQNYVTLNLDNIKAMISLSDGLPSVKQRIYLLYHVYKEMTAKKGFDWPEIFQLAYRVKAEKKNSMEQNTDRLLEYIESSLPNGIKAFFWDPYISLKSRRWPTNDLIVIFLGSDNKNHLWTCNKSERDQRLFTTPAVEEGNYVRLIHKKTNLAVGVNQTDLNLFDLTTDLNETTLWRVIPVDNGKYVGFINKKYTNRVIDVFDFDDKHPGCTVVYCHDGYTTGSHQHFVIN